MHLSYSLCQMAADRIRQVGVSAFRAGAFESRPDEVATEEPLEIRLGDDALAVLMRTPGEDVELAAGFLLAEGIIREADHIDLIRHCMDGDSEAPNVVNATLSSDRAQTAEALLAERRAERSTVTSSSCGVCGKRTIESLFIGTTPFESQPNLQDELIQSYPEKLRQGQAVFERTGGLHAAAIFDASGQRLVVREDIGRHNAVDKCVGFLLLRELLPLRDATLMVSGRCSFEIIQKALAAGIQTVCAVSAPTSLAVSLAIESKMGLVGFLRGGSFNVYAPVP